jgi:hypothetical protein
MKYEYVALTKLYSLGKIEVLSSKVCPTSTSSTTNGTGTCLRSRADLGSKWPATNRLSRGMALKK